MADSPGTLRPAAFFDVDGTLVRSTIVHYYAYFRCRMLPSWWRPVWRTAFLIRCTRYLVLDKIDRRRLNVVFYRNYAGLHAQTLRGQAEDCYLDVIAPRLFAEAVPCVDAHRAAGRAVVLVTGSIDFTMAPLAQRIGAEAVLAPALIERDGRFTGELDSAPVAGEEKARRMREFAAAQHVDLSQSFGYGDSIADLPMLEAVGIPHAVNPDRALAAVARERNWPVLAWSLPTAPGGNGRC